MAKADLKIKAIELRKKGCSYSEIRKEIPVAKATLSLWLKSVGLAKSQKQRLTQKKLDAALRGARKRKEQRLALTATIKQSAAQEIGILERQARWLVGAALYWAEGNKQKENNVSCGIKFSNSDAQMLIFFYKWLLDFCGVDKKDVIFELYLHVSANKDDALAYWSKILSADQSQFTSVRWKKGNSVSYRKNKGQNYHGLIRLNVKSSTNLNRRIMGWVEEICKQFNHSGVV